MNEPKMWLTCQNYERGIMVEVWSGDEEEVDKPKWDGSYWEALWQEGVTVIERIAKDIPIKHGECLEVDSISFKLKEKDDGK